jgi:dTDP-4-amino-4,6-dideoxygalactose transaminase
MERILQTNPRLNYLAHREEIDAAVARVMDKGWYILGEEVSAMEREFASYLGVGFAWGVGNGTDALHIALRALGIGAGDEVITVSHTAVATVAAIELCGAVPVLVDSDPRTYTMSPELAAVAIGPRTRAIIPVHLYGRPAELDQIIATARRRGVAVIEDCAQSHGAVYRGKTTGRFGDIACFSFYPTKNLGALGDGGMVVTNDSALADRVKLVREYGWKDRYVSAIAGFNSRLDELQAGILRVKLPYLQAENARRRTVAAAYAASLDSSRMTLPESPAELPGHVYHQFVIQVDQRDKIREMLSKDGIHTLIHYPVPVHLQPAYAGRIRCAGPMTATEQFARRIVSLPIYPELTDAQVERIIDAVNGAVQRVGA